MDRIKLLAETVTAVGGVLTDHQVNPHGIDFYEVLDEPMPHIALVNPAQLIAAYAHVGDEAFAERVCPAIALFVTSYLHAIEVDGGLSDGTDHMVFDLMQQSNPEAVEALQWAS